MNLWHALALQPAKTHFRNLADKLEKSWRWAPGFLIDPNFVGPWQPIAALSGCACASPRRAGRRTINPAKRAARTHAVLDWRGE
jgi:hypothetical protein